MNAIVEAVAVDAANDWRPTAAVDTDRMPFMRTLVCFESYKLFGCPHSLRLSKKLFDPVRAARRVLQKTRPNQ